MKLNSTRVLTALLAAAVLLVPLSSCSAGLVNNVNTGEINPNTDQTEFDIMGGISALSSGYENNEVLNALQENVGIKITQIRLRIFFIEVRNRDVDLDSRNQETKKFCIKPELNDIKYLIIKSEQERIEVLKKIDELFGETMTANNIALLKSKILTCGQIRKDF